MTTVTASSVARSARVPRHARAARVGLWTLRIALAAQFALAGVLKVAAEPSMVTMFDDIGAGQGLRLVIGICEIAAAGGLLIPRLVLPAARGLVLLMGGAALTNALILQTSPAAPLVLGVFAAAIVVARKKVSGR